MAKKKLKNAYRFYYQQTGEHYTIRLSKQAFEKMSSAVVKKYSSKLRKHVEFKVIKNKGK
jgi:ribosomal protein L33